MLVAPDSTADARLWRLPAPACAPLHMALVSAGAMPPLDLQLMADLMARGQAAAEDCVANGALRIEQRALAAYAGAAPHVLVLADDFGCAATSSDWPSLVRLVEDADHVFLLGAAARWWAGTRWAHGQRVAMHWSERLDPQALAHGVQASSAIFEVQGRWTSCCGSAATLDLGLCLLRDTLGAPVARRVQDDLCIAVVRRPGEAQRATPAEPVLDLAPKLVEALALMRANIEEPLMTEDIASLVGLSRRQLERLFKRQFDTVPSRYYLELRLQRARQLLTEPRHSLLEIGLMCGFSSGSHFSSSYSAVFGTTPREERQRVLGRGAARPAEVSQR